MRNDGVEDQKSHKDNIKRMGRCMEAIKKDGQMYGSNQKGWADVWKQSSVIFFLSTFRAAAVFNCLISCVIFKG